MFTPFTLTQTHEWTAANDHDKLSDTSVLGDANTIKHSLHKNVQNQLVFQRLNV